MLAPLALGARPLCSLVDSIAARTPHNPFHLFPPKTGESLNGEAPAECLLNFSGGDSLRPEYTRPSLQWLLDKVAEKRRHGVFQKVVVRDGERLLGGALYYLRRGGVSQVIQITASRESFHTVLDHLFYHAWRHEATALAGRLEPRFLREFSARQCLFQCEGPWVLIHARKPELLEPIHRGDANLTRLDGEWWMRFHG